MQIIYKTKQNWLNGRKKGIGGSESSAVVGYNPYKSNVELWEEKIGLTQPPDISDKSYVQYGQNAEKLLVKLFELDYPQYKVNYNNNYRVNYSDKYPFLYCTRDCDLIDKETGKKGALEIKTTEILSSMHKEKWNEQIPNNYYCQLLQYFITDNDLDFVWLKAQIKSDFGNGDIRIATKHYYFTREQLKEDIEWLEQEEVNFWNNYVVTGKQPPKKLPNLI